MKIKTALIVGLLILNGSAYAMVANGISFPKSFSPKPVNAPKQFLKIPVSKSISAPIPDKPARIQSKLDSLIAEYQVNRRLSSSS